MVKFPFWVTVEPESLPEGGVAFLLVVAAIALAAILAVIIEGVRNK